MNNRDSFGYPGDGPAGPVQPAPPQPGLPLAQYKFSPEEARVLAECNSESFFKRSMPLGTALGIGTFTAIQNGYLKPSPRFGPFPKVTLAVMVGYFIGKLSYQQACAEKLMALPGSYIGQLLREKRDGRVGPASQKQVPTMFGASPNDIYSDAGPGTSLDLDTDRPLFSDDNFTSESDGAPSLDSAPQRPVLSYEELRRKNRMDYADARQDPYKMDPSVPPVTRPRPTPPPPTQPKNKYGDIID